MSDIRVLIADDHRMVREGLARLLDAAAGIEVVGLATNGREAVELATQLSPDLILMDVRMPGCDGIAATRELMALGVKARILALTTFDDDDYVFKILEAGAIAYLTKDVEEDELIHALRTVAKGGTMLSPAVAEKVMKRLQSDSNPLQKQSADKIDKDPPSLSAIFSSREIDILNLLNAGKNSHEIAGALHIAEGTVRNTLSRIYEKLNVRDRVQAVMEARKNGLLNE